MLKTQSKDRSFIADAGLKGTGFLFRSLNKLKMLGVFIFLPFAGVEAMSAFFCFFAFRTFPLPFRLPRMLSRTRFCCSRCFASSISSSCRFNSSRAFGESFWLSGMWISRFMCSYNLHFGATGKTMFSKGELFQQLVPSLEFVYALRKAFGVPVGVGRIWNADESMSFRYDSNTKSWVIG